MSIPAPEPKPRRALVLAGGGSKGAFEVGVLQRLMGDQQLEYELLCGTSVGAINAAYLAQTPLGQPREAVAKLRALWDTVTTDKVHKSWFPFGKVSAFFKPSVYDSSPVHDWIRAGLDVNAVRSSGKRLRVVAVSLGTGESFVANAQTPFDVRDAHAIPQILLRSIDIMNGEVSRADLRIAGLKNDLSQLRPEYRKVKIRLFQPTEPLPFDSLDFDPGNLRKMIDAGYAQSAVSA